MRGLSSLLFLVVFWSFFSAQVEGRIGAKNVLIRAPQSDDEGESDKNPGPGNGQGPPPGKGPGRPPGKGQRKKAVEVPISTTTTQTTSPPPPPSSSSTSTTAPPVSTSSSPESNFLSRTTEPRLSFIPTMISAVLPTPSSTFTPATPQETFATSDRAVETTLLGNSRITLVPLPTPLPSQSTPSPGVVFKEPNPDTTSSSPQRTLVIVLSVVLGSVGLLLLCLSVFLLCRFRKKRAAMRGVSPIDEDEIQSWRHSEAKKAFKSTPTSPRQAPVNHLSVGPLASPGWEWFTFDELRSPAPTHSRGPSLLAKAPNARIGLTTDSAPGAEPYLPPVKRQSSRLSKAPRRTKSTRSSFSAKSTRSIEIPESSTANYPRHEFGAAESAWLASDSRSHVFSTAETSSPGTSIYDGFNEIQGLSPRPKYPMVPVFPNFAQPTGLSPPPVKQAEDSPRMMIDTPPGWPMS